MNKFVVYTNCYDNGKNYTHSNPFRQLTLGKTYNVIDVLIDMY